MPTPLIDLTTVQDYTIPALRRAMHHAQNVADIIPAVLGNVLLYAAPGSLVGRGDGTTLAGNSGWLTSRATGRRFAVVYFHKSGAIEIRDRNQNGAVLYAFTNASSHRDIARAFMSL